MDMLPKHHRRQGLLRNPNSCCPLLDVTVLGSDISVLALAVSVEILYRGGEGSVSRGRGLCEFLHLWVLCMEYSQCDRNGDSLVDGSTILQAHRGSHILPLGLRRH